VTERAPFALLVAAAVASVAALPWVVRDYYDVAFSRLGWHDALGVGVPSVAVFGWAASIELRGGNRRALAWTAFAAGLFEAFIEFWPGAFALWVVAVLQALLSRRAR
jgi:hypothetical protein